MRHPSPWGFGKLFRQLKHFHCMGAYMWCWTRCLSRSDRVMKKGCIFLFSQTGKATWLLTSGTITSKLITRDIAWSSSVVPSKANKSATAPPGPRGAASEASSSKLSKSVQWFVIYSTDQSVNNCISINCPVVNNMKERVPWITSLLHFFTAAVPVDRQIVRLPLLYRRTPKL